MGLHWPELFVVLVVALIFLGPKRLPEAGRSLGKAIRGFRDETKDFREEVSAIKDDAHSIGREMTDVRNTVHNTVTDATVGSEAVRAPVGASSPSVPDEAPEPAAQ